MNAFIQQRGWTGSWTHSFTCMLDLCHYSGKCQSRDWTQRDFQRWRGECCAAAVDKCKQLKKRKVRVNYGDEKCWFRNCYRKEALLKSAVTFQSHCKKTLSENLQHVHTVINLTFKRRSEPQLKSHAISNPPLSKTGSDSCGCATTRVIII